MRLYIEREATPTQEVRCNEIQSISNSRKYPTVMTHIRRQTYLCVMRYKLRPMCNALTKSIGTSSTTCKKPHKFSSYIPRWQVQVIFLYHHLQRNHEGSPNSYARRRHRHSIRPKCKFPSSSRSLWCRWWHDAMFYWVLVHSHRFNAWGVHVFTLWYGPLDLKQKSTSGAGAKLTIIWYLYLFDHYTHRFQSFSVKFPPQQGSKSGKSYSPTYSKSGKSKSGKGTPAPTNPPTPRPTNPVSYLIWYYFSLL